jgi:hypothetical protein
MQVVRGHSRVSKQHGTAAVGLQAVLVRVDDDGIGVRNAVERANKTLQNVMGAWVKDQEVTIDNGKVTGYKVILKVTSILSD